MDDLATNPRVDFVVTKDFYRVDVGFITFRKPIFFQMHDLDYENVKREHAFKLKYDLYPHISKDLLEVNALEMRKTKTESTGKDNEGDIYKDMPNGERVYYKSNATAFDEISSQVMLKKHIQRASAYNIFLIVKVDGRWTFPRLPMQNGETMTVAKDRLFKEMFRGSIMGNFLGHFPITVRKEPFEERDKENPYSMKCVGKKVFYFDALIEYGEPEITSDLGDDWAWVTKLEINKYLNREDFEHFNKFLRVNNMH